MLNVPVIDHWWQSQTGWSIAANCVGIESLPVKPGSPTRAVPGYRVDVLDDKGRLQGLGQIGSIAIKLPLPPGSLSTLWNADERYREAHLDRFEGYYLTGDAGYIDEDQYL
jgi:propionyl-CoA synthetase